MGLIVSCQRWVTGVFRRVFSKWTYQQDQAERREGGRSEGGWREGDNVVYTESPYIEVGVHESYLVVH